MIRTWDYRASNNIKKSIRKDKLEGGEIEPEKVFIDSTSALRANVQLKLLVVKKHHDHVFLQVNQYTCEEIDSVSAKEEDVRYDSIVSSLKKMKE